MRFFKWVDYCLMAALALYGVAVLGTLLFAPKLAMPSEDAVILFQYSKNLAQHGAITYYAGGPHAEGATDFLWMVLIAGAMKLGASPFVFVSIMNFCALPLLALVLLRLGGLRATWLRILAICGAAGLCPQMIAAMGGFSVLVFALLLALLVLAVQQRKVTAAALIALVVCLFRPDGVVFAVPLLIALMLPPGDRLRRLLPIGLGFVLPGLIYFAWRTQYFGGLFPLPFLVKSDTVRVFGYFEPTSFQVSLKYLGFDAALTLPLLWRAKSQAPKAAIPFRGRYVLLATMVAVPTMFYWAMRLSQNVGERFYFFLPLAAAMMIVSSWETLATTRKRTVAYAGLAAWPVLLMSPMQILAQTFLHFQSEDIVQIGQAMRHMPGRGTMLTTEAGYLAYDSDWVTYDAWGLNTRQFAERMLQPADVVALRPDLVVVHPDHSDPCTPAKDWPAAYTGRTWVHMTRNLVLGTHDAEGYQLWVMPFGTPIDPTKWNAQKGDRECFLVRQDSTFHDELVEVLKQHHAVNR